MTLEQAEISKIEYEVQNNDYQYCYGLGLECPPKATCVQGGAFGRWLGYGNAPLITGFMYR